MNLGNVITQAEQVLAFTHEQLAHMILQGLCQGRRNEIRARYARDIQGRPVLFHLQQITHVGYALEYEYEIGLAVREAWAWMERELILVAADGINGGNGFRVISRLGQTFLDEGNARSLSAARMIDRELLHKSLRGDALDNFWRGLYDVAVFCAYRAVEVAVRRASALPDTRIGTQLMRDAFNPSGGVLRDAALPAAEQEAMMSLFSGAIGLFKNPNSHRYVQITPESSAELVVLASHLLKLVDARNSSDQKE